MSGLSDKISGRVKQAAGDLAADENLREQGLREERKADAKRELAKAQAEVEARSEEIAQLERDAAHERGQRQLGAVDGATADADGEPGRTNG